MTYAQKIKMVLGYKGIKEAELARLIQTSPSAFNQRMKTDKFTVEDLEKIADILGGTFTPGFFEFPDGTKI